MPLRLWSDVISRAQEALPACPGQVKIEMGQVKFVIYLPDGASKYILDFLFDNFSMRFYFITLWS